MVAEIWMPQIDMNLCTGCGECIVVCPTGALALVGTTAVLMNSGACHYCGGCEATCPVEAITLPYQITLESA